MRDSEIKEHGLEDEAIECVFAPGNFNPGLVVTGIVERCGTNAADRTDQTADQSSETETEASRSKVGRGSDGRTRGGADPGTDCSGAARIDRVGGQLPVGLHAAKDFLGDAAAAQTVQFDERVRECAEAVGRLGGKGRLRVRKTVLFLFHETEMLDHREHVVFESGRRNRFAGRDLSPDMQGDGVERTRIDGSASANPDGAKRIEGRLRFCGKRFGQRVEERRFLHPAPRKRIHGKDAFDEVVRCEFALPEFELGPFVFGRTGFAHLIEEHDDGFADPGKNLHLGGDVGRDGRPLGRVHEVKHDA